MYTVVEGKSLEETKPRVKDKVHVKDVNGTWEGIVYTLGTFILNLRFWITEPWSSFQCQSCYKEKYVSKININVFPLKSLGSHHYRPFLRIVFAHGCS